MSELSTVLQPSLRDLDETIADFRVSSFQSCESVLARLLHQLDEEPMAGFLAAVLPMPDFQPWLNGVMSTGGAVVGSGVLTWPLDRAERVAMQISLCKAIVVGKPKFLEFAHKFIYTRGDLAGHVDAFTTKVLEPLVRDVRRLTEVRVVPPVLFEAMGALPPSGDHTLDTLLKEASTKFRDPAPQSRADAVQKLWDAWERLKSLDVEGNKRMSVAKLLDTAAPERTFRALLETEARALTEAGNTFHIRHFEADKVALDDPEHGDYLFHRLFALMHLLLYSRRRSAQSAS